MGSEAFSRVTLLRYEILPVLARMCRMFQTGTVFYDIPAHQMCLYCVCMRRHCSYQYTMKFTGKKVSDWTMASRFNRSVAIVGFWTRDCRASSPHAPLLPLMIHSNTSHECQPIDIFRLNTCKRFVNIFYPSMVFKWQIPLLSLQFNSQISTFLTSTSGR